MRFEGLFRLVDGTEANQAALLARMFTISYYVVSRSLTVLIRLSHGGFLAQKRTTYDTEVAGYAKTAIKQDRIGQAPEFVPQLSELYRPLPRLIDSKIRTTRWPI